MKGYTNVGIPQAIVLSIRDISPLLGYRTISEFVVEATRRHLTVKQMEFDRRLQQLAEKESKPLV